MIHTVHPPPTWLEGRWADQKDATVMRIAGAVASLCQTGNKVTYNSICRSVQSLYGVSISANTIKRNHAAYAIYTVNRSARQCTLAKERTLQKVIQSVPEDRRNRLYSRVARLRKIRKDRLIVMLLELEDSVDGHKVNETNLRDEILRLSTRTGSH
jgi:hypothetical protein